jgi:hypothetical protein
MLAGCKGDVKGRSISLLWEVSFDRKVSRLFVVCDRVYDRGQKASRLWEESVVS